MMCQGGHGSDVCQNTGVSYREIRIYRLLDKWGFPKGCHGRKGLSTQHRKERFSRKNTRKTFSNSPKVRVMVQDGSLFP